MITSGLQDYIELIYNSSSNNINIKAVDIANHFKISRASVSEALIRLADLDLIVYEGRKGIKITEKGEKEAKNILKKHLILEKFFNEVLEVGSEISSKNACRIEHVIDEELIDKIEDFTDFYLKNVKDSKIRKSEL